VAFVFFIALRLLGPTQEVIVSAVDISDEEVIERARSLGMVTIRELPESSETEPVLLAERQAEDLEILLTLLMQRNLELVAILDEHGEFDDKVFAVDTVPGSSMDEPALVTDMEGHSQITIPRGLNSIDIAVLFFTNGIVDSAIDFNNFVIANDMTTRLVEGTYNIREGASYEEILSTISFWPN